MNIAKKSISDLELLCIANDKFCYRVLELEHLSQSERLTSSVGFFCSKSKKQSGTNMHQKVVPDRDFSPFLADEIEQSVAQRFEKQVEAYRDSIAVCDEDKCFTYGEFNEFANQIAHGILAHAISANGRLAQPSIDSESSTDSEQIVLFFEQGANFLGAIFGVLKSGKCYVPIDPRFPEIRNRYILNHSQAHLVVTNTANLAAARTLTQGPEAKICCILNIDTLATDLPKSNPGLDISPDALAYIIYTSGSTGKPKGVFQSQRNLLHNAKNQINAFHLGVGDRMPLVHSCSVMGAVRVIFNALLSGSALYPFDVKAQGLNALRSLLINQKITAFHAVATLFRHFAEIFQAADAFPYLRLVILGGEAMSRKDVAFYKQHFPDNCLLCTGLGSTEAGTTRIFILNKETEITAGQVPPGYAVAGQDVLLWDEQGEAVAAGEVGEIVIQSEYLALGYWQRADTNPQTFVPIAPGSAVRRFRTGDLGRMLPDGCLVHMGRKDFQVKIRGYRVNVAEIEAALMDSNWLKETVVVGRENPSGEIALAAYVVLKEGSSKTEEALRNFLKQRLPDYMMPSAFVFLAALPQTPNDKLDRRALPDPPAPQPTTGVDFVPPQTSTEKTLAAIWQKVFGIWQIGIRDNFFELGGHSLLAAQIIAHVQTACQVDIPFSLLLEAPTIAELSVAVESLAVKSLAAGSSSIPRTIPRRPQAEPCSLSFAQQRLWFLQQLDPNSSAYHIHRTLQLRGPLNKVALQRAFTTIVKRHEALRTTFVVVDGTPKQNVLDPSAFDLSFVDLSRDEAAAESTAQILAAEESRPFNLSADLLLRATLIQQDEAAHLLQIVMHHIAADGWSISVFKQELGALYGAYASDQASPLVALPVQYGDFSQWQRQWLTGEVLTAQLRYWKQQLAGASPLLALPTDRPRPARSEDRGARQSFSVSRSVSDRLRALGQQNNATLFMTLLAAFNLLLYRYSGQTDIVVGSPIANRNRSELEGMIGFFANTLALRADLTGKPSFEDLLKRVRKTALEAYAHQTLPFEKLVEDLQPERNLAYSPLFQVFFALQTPPKQLPSSQLAGLSIERGPSCLDEAAGEVAKFDLTLSMREAADGLSGVFKYRSDLFEASTVARMAGHFQQLLAVVVSAPADPIEALPMLTAAEQQQLIDWNQTQVAYAENRCIHQLFEAQVERTPAAVALTYKTQSCTYRALNNRANQLARYLQRQGVAPETLVGLCVTRSLDTIVALLAILKAGGAYVPLDPTYPQTRLAQIAADAELSIVVTEAAIAHEGHFTQATVLIDCDAIAQESTHNLNVPVAPNNLAYVIYTSGSTGTPKGVMIQHRSVSHLSTALKQAIDVYQQPQPLTVSLNGSIAFDTSVKQIVQLLHGHRLEIVPEETRTDSTALLAYLRDCDIDVFDCTPSQLSLLLSAGLLEAKWRDRPLHILLGGEAINEATWHRLRAAKYIHFYNVYGPTECTVNATVCALKRCDRPTLGRPIANVQTYILDSQRAPVPIGVPGELHIGGAGLARGYLNRPKLTAKQFIPHPFPNSSPDERLYKTGDLARYREDGTIEFLGRMDRQVKLRGHRIELGEVETVLAQQAGVQQAVVVLREGKGAPEMVGYVAIAPDQSLAGSNLQHALSQHLKRSLPRYMVPARLVLLKALPLTANGKVDVRSLPAHTETERSIAFSAPQTPAEKTLAQIWCSLLQHSQISTQDNFFELGGHSLLAAQVISRIRQRFNLSLPLKRLFEFPTIAQLAACIERSAGLGDQQRDEAAQLLPPIVRRQPSEPALLSFAQQRLWFLQQLEAAGSRYHITWALRLQGPLQVEALARSLTTLLNRHETLRTCFPKGKAGAPQQRLLPTDTFELHAIDLSAAGELASELKALLEQLSRQPFDLAADLMMRAALIRLKSPKETHVLHIVIHHIATDGWSMDVFRRELSELYNAYAAQQPNPLVALPLQYSDFAQWQRQWLSDTALEPQLSYWQQQLEGAPPLLALPTDFSRPAQPAYRGGRVNFQIAAPTTQALKTLSQQHSATLFMTLLAAFNTLLHRYTQQTDIVVGSPSANRSRAELEALVGFFANTLALRTDLSGNPTFGNLLKRVRQTALDAYTHQSLPFEKLVEALQPERSLSYSPLFQVLFVLQNSDPSALKLNNLNVQLEPVDNETAKFDLTLAVRDRGECLTGALKYNADLFTSQTITRMVAHFQRLLESIVARPNLPISDLPMLTAAERQQLVTWNDTQADDAVDDAVDDAGNRCVHALFERQVEKTPTAIALVYENQQLTYQQLNQKANQLARYLQALGVGPEKPVGLCTARSPEMIVALLAVLKAGGAYVPLDPVLPKARLRYMLENSGAAVLITQQAVAAALPDFAGQVSLEAAGLEAAGLEVVCLDRCAEAIARQPESNLPAQTALHHLAYVLYTSGSTGEPKGVAVEHRHLLNYIHGITTRLELSGCASFATVSTLAADLGNTAIFPALSTGATLHIISQARITDPNALAAYFCEHPIDCLKIVPSHLSALLTATHPEQVLPRQSLILGGESCCWALINTVKQLAPDCAIFNHYGPTETTIGVATCELTGAAQSSTLPPIGRPLPNSQMYLLDAHRQPVPVGATGELYIGGAGLARGYFNRPALTAEKFVVHSFRRSPHARLYRTGDLGRYLPDGQIELLGRADSQVKVRGNRVEIGEVEAALSQHPAVQQCVALVEEGRDRLVAYVSSAQASLDYRAFLQQTLPEYMIPSVFISLDALPLTPNGKIDRQKLKQIGTTAKTSPAAAHTTLQTRTAPRTPLEKGIAKIWREVLALDNTQSDSIAVQDSFFEVGGHSLLAIHLMTQLQTQLSCHLPLSVLFQAPTIEQLAAVIAREKTLAASGESTSLVQLQVGSPHKAPIFFVHPVGGGVFCYKDLTTCLGPEYPLYGLQSRHLASPKALAASLSIEDMAAGYLAEIRRVQPEGPYRLGGWSMGGLVAFEIAQQLQVLEGTSSAQPQPIASLILIDSHRPNPRKQNEGESALLTRFAKHLSLSKTKSLSMLTHLADLKQHLQQQVPSQPLNRRIVFLLNWLKHHRVVHADLGPSQLQHLFFVFKENFRAANAYKPQPYDGAIDLFTCQEPVNQASQKQSAQVAFWQSLAPQKVTVQEVPANHFTILHPPHVSMVADQMHRASISAEKDVRT